MNVNIHSIDTLRSLKQSLDRYARDVVASLDALERETANTQEWLTERCLYWQRQAEASQSALRAAQSALVRCEATVYRDPKTGYIQRPNCSAYRATVDQCTVQLRQIEGELHKVKGAQRSLDQIYLEFRKQRQHFQGYLSSEIVKAQVFLERRASSLESYTASSSANGLPLRQISPNNTEMPILSDVSEVIQEDESSSTCETSVAQSDLLSNSATEVTRPRDGHEFERWANSKYFGNEGRRLNVDIYDNYKHLDIAADSGLGLMHERRTDIYWDRTGEIWELKSGYESGSISLSQLDDYQSMLNAGYVYERAENGNKTKRPVNNVYYLFGTEQGARNNAGKFKGRDIFVCYVDDNGDIQQLYL